MRAIIHAGDCIATAKDACNLSGFTLGCFARYFSCSCYHTLIVSQDSGERQDMGSGLMGAGLMGSGLIGSGSGLSKYNWGQLLQ